MPYIAQRERDLYDRWLGLLRPQSVGDLNYVITRIVQNFLPKEPHYSDFNDVIGVLESAKLELYRRAVAPYEDQKIAENGDVY